MHFARYLINIVVVLLLLPSSGLSEVNIAVLEFKGKGVSNVEASALTDRLTLELVQTGQFEVLEREQMDKILKEQGFQMSGCVETECIVNIGVMVGVDQMVGGSVSKVGNVFSISAKLISVETGKIVGIAFYDYEGALGELLTTGMRNVASQLANYQNQSQIADENQTVQPMEEVQPDSAETTLAADETSVDVDSLVQTDLTKGNEKRPWTPLVISVLPDLSFGKRTSNVYGIRVLLSPRRHHDVIGIDGGIWGGVDQDIWGVAGKIVNTAGGNISAISAGVYTRAGRSIRGFNYAGTRLEAKEHILGVNAGVFSLIAGGDVVGINAGGLRARVSGNQTGIIAGGISNTVGGDMTGLQIGLYNRAENLKGLQIGLWNVNRSGKRFPIINVGW